MSVNYNHKLNLHTTSGPRSAFCKLFSSRLPGSLLDVGCGTGTWLSAALNAGVQDVFGVDGVDIPKDHLLFPADSFRQINLTDRVDLRRRFDAVICFEVAEHLDGQHADTLVDTLVRHGDLIYFSAAAPGQPGQHHVNCQWPIYWQNKFNERGYVCDDEVRWRIWDDSSIEPWYRQNMFVARRAAEEAGEEPRITAVIHPEMMDWLKSEMVHDAFQENAKTIVQGVMPASWYLSVPFRAAWGKIRGMTDRSSTRVRGGGIGDK